MPAEYQFVDRWFVPAPVEEVYDLIGDQLSYPSWWGEVFLSVTGDGGPPRPGRRASVVAKGFLPYKLHFDAETTEAERPRKITMRLSGDFQGGGFWTFTEQGDGTEAVLDWRPIVEKPFVKHLTPVLRPLFRANHNWTMRRGQEAALRLVRDGHLRQPGEAGA
jgi:uncharacterized protein YndB with AHSA1/START domain